MVTKQTCLQGFIDKYPGATSLTAKQSTFFDRALRALLAKAEFRQDSESFVAIVAGTSEYAWPEGSKALGATWYESATSHWGLLMTSEAALRDLDPDWPASIRSASPRRFYLSARSTGLVIGFDTAPSVSSVSGYPKAVVQTEESASLGLTDTIPPSLLDELPIVYRMCQYWAEEHDKGMLSTWLTMADNADKTAVKHLRTLIPALPQEQSLPPAVAFNRRII